MDGDMSKEEAIKFFRSYIAEKDGISEEEAGKKINKSVDLGLGMLEPLTELTEKIRKIGEKSPRDMFTVMKSTIANLLSNVPLKMRKLVLIELLLLSDDDEKMKNDMDRSIDKYFESKFK